MNNIRRKAIEKLVSRIEDISSDLNDILSDEEYAFDSMPENLHYSERGEIAQDAISIMSDCIDKLEDIVVDLGEIV